MDDNFTIADAVLELVPEAIGRENCVLPFEVTNELLSLYYPADLASPAPLEDKLRFVLDRPVRLVPLERRKLREEIEVHYSRLSPYEVLTPIENCEPLFRYKCTRKWHSLTPTADESVRHFPECNQPVYRYSIKADLQSLRGLRCVFIQYFETLVHPTKAYLVSGEGVEVSCIMCDIDKFKSINDNHGHSKGDEVLKRVAEVLL